MECLVIGVAAFLISGLTLFSGFGLGTLLLPFFLFFVPVGPAVGLTAVVHLLNNLFKLSMLGKFANRRVALSFGIPAVIFAFIGAWCLGWFAGMKPLYEYMWLGRVAEVTVIKLVMASLIAFFALMEMVPILQKSSFGEKNLMAGGVLSGFFGGLSGHQGALRSAFLIKCGLSKEAFIATNVVIACVVDIARLGVYTSRFSSAFEKLPIGIVATAILCAFLGAYVGRRTMKKVALRAVQRLVAGLLFIIAVGLATGLI